MTKILLVDDDLEILESTSALLREFGYEVTTCSDSDKVIERMRIERPDLVLHDVRMPGLDLRAQIISIRDEPDIGHTPVVLFTAVMSAKSLAEEVGADDAIEKPFDAEKLLRVIHESAMRTSRREKALAWTPRKTRQEHGSL